MSSSAHSAPANASAPVTSSRSLSPAAKADRSAAATCPRLAAGRLASNCPTWPCRTMVATRGADAVLARSEGTASACARLRSKAAAKIEPSAAMPVAMPTWRNVELTPDAMPAWCGGTTPIAVEASGGLTIPAPRPLTMKPGIRSVHELLPDSPAMMISPMPTSSRPGPMSQRAGTRSLTRPATVAVTNCAPLMMASRRPACSAE